MPHVRSHRIGSRRAKSSSPASRSKSRSRSRSRSRSKSKKLKSAPGRIENTEDGRRRSMKSRERGIIRKLDNERGITFLKEIYGELTTPRLSSFQRRHAVLNLGAPILPDPQAPESLGDYEREIKRKLKEMGIEGRESINDKRLRNKFIRYLGESYPGRLNKVQKIVERLNKMA